MFNTVYYHSCENMSEVKDKSVDLAIVSPPFSNATNNSSLNKSSYLNFLEKVFLEVYRTLKDSGVFISINTDLRDHAKYNEDNKKYEKTIWFKHNDIREVAESIGLSCFENKIWVKSLKINAYRYNYSYIMFFRKINKKIKQNYNYDFKPDVWLYEGGTQRRLNNFIFRNAVHPKIIELCIKEFTDKQDIVLSPFTGSGTILSIANYLNRSWIGYEINEKLKNLIETSISDPLKFKPYNSIER